MFVTAFKTEEWMLWNVALCVSHIIIEDRRLINKILILSVGYFPNHFSLPNSKELQTARIISINKNRN